MSPKEIILKLISRIGFSKSILSSNKGRFYSTVPGEVISKLSPEERKILQDLKPEDLAKVTSDAPVEFFCDEFYRKKDEEDFEKKLKSKFDKEQLRK